MDTETGPEQAWTTDACTLPTAEQPLRVAEFDALFAAHLDTVEAVTATSARMLLTGDARLEARVRDLADRESACCSFFAFTVTGRATGVALDIAVPTAHAGVLAALLARAHTVKAGA